MSKTSFAQQQLKSLVDRILRLKEEQDTIGEDVREVYAEAHGHGFNKTTLGQLVTHLRKVKKNGLDKMVESTAMFELYLEAYNDTQTGSEVQSDQAAQKTPVAPVSTPAIVQISSHAHTRGTDSVPHDPETGEITAGDVPAFLRRQSA